MTEQNQIQETPEASVDEIDFGAHYSISGWAAGIAWYLRSYATKWTQEDWTFLGDDDDDRDREDESLWAYDEPEEIEDRSRVLAVMVGDDRVFTVDVEDLTKIGEEDFCRGCGQIGCGCEVWS